MKIVTPEVFLREFFAVVDEYRGDLVKRWDNSKRYTEFVFSTVLPRLGERLGLSWCPEYYTLDAVFFEERDTEHFPGPGSIYAKHIAT